MITLSILIKWLGKNVKCYAIYLLLWLNFKIVGKDWGKKILCIHSSKRIFLFLHRCLAFKESSSWVSGRKEKSFAWRITQTIPIRANDTLENLKNHKKEENDEVIVNLEEWESGLKCSSLSSLYQINIKSLEFYETSPHSGVSCFLICKLSTKLDIDFLIQAFHRYVFDFLKWQKKIKKEENGVERTWTRW